MNCEYSSFTKSITRSKLPSRVYIANFLKKPRSKWNYTTKISSEISLRFPYDSLFKCTNKNQGDAIKSFKNIHQKILQNI